LPKQCLFNSFSFARGHVEHRGVSRGDSVFPARRLGAFRGARGRKYHAARNQPLRKRHAEVSARRERGRNTRNNFDLDRVRFQKADLFVRAAEEHRVATFEPHHHAVAARGVGETLVDEALRSGMAAAAFSDGDFHGAFCQRERFRVNQGVVEHYAGLGQQPRRAKREEVRRARPRADEIHRADKIGGLKIGVRPQPRESGSDPDFADRHALTADR
jgi:hypothetical protein